MNSLIPIAIIGAGAAFAVSAASANTPPVNYTGTGSDNPEGPINYEPDMTGNIDAFLSLIRDGESNNNYRALVGGGVFSDFSHHPGWTDASMTVKSSWEGWRNSHAAGAYQFQPQTFKEASNYLGLDGDFSPESQDLAAIWALNRRGAYDDIAAGDILTAVSKLRNEWEIFVKMDYESVVNAYCANGGYLA